MAPKFGNFLFHAKNKGNSAASPQSHGSQQRGDPFEMLATQAIKISPEEVQQPDLNLRWDLVLEKHVLIPLGEIDGLKAGRATIRAVAMAARAPQLFETPPAEELEISLVLSRVIEQVGNLFPTVQQAVEDAKSYDTPISQAMREDEAKLAASKREDSASRYGSPRPQIGGLLRAEPENNEPPEFTPEDRPEIPLEFLREKSLGIPEARSPIKDMSTADPEGPKTFVSEGALFADAYFSPEPAEPTAAGEEPTAATTTEIPAEDKAPTPEPVSSAAPAAERLSLPQSARAPNGPEPPASDTAQPPGKPRPEPVSQATRIRTAQDKLQQIFLTEDYLDARTVAEHILKLPKVRDAVVLAGNSVFAGDASGRLNRRELATQAPALFAQIEHFLRQIEQDEPLHSVTFHLSPSVTAVKEGRVHIVILHTGRNLVPGLRDRLVEAANALNEMY